MRLLWAPVIVEAERPIGSAYGSRSRENRRKEAQRHRDTEKTEKRRKRKLFEIFSSV
jgi:hypothetical protein